MQNEENLTHAIWTEKYRPQVVSDCILPTGLTNQANGYIQSGKMPNLLLAGSAGTGKTTLAKALCNDMGFDWKMINGSDEGRLLDTLRVEVRRFASTKSMTGRHKCIIIDEGDYMPADTVQPALRSFFEEYSENCNFIITCNFINRMMEAIKSRTVIVDYTIPASEKKNIMKQMFGRICYILDTEGFEYDKKVILELINQFYPDFRRLINEIQRYANTVLATGGNKIDSGILSIASTAEIDTIVGFLKDKEFNKMRKWVAQNTSIELDVLCRKLYDSTDKILKNESIPDFVRIISEYQYRNAFVADKEINMVAFLTETMSSLEFK